MKKINPYTYAEIKSTLMKDFIQRKVEEGKMERKTSNELPGDIREWTGPKEKKIKEISNFLEEGKY